MTNEEAITYANCLKNNYTINFDDMADFCDIAIKALEQEPCEDAISRKAVLEIQAKYAEYIGATKFWQMRDEIKVLPPITPQSKTGHWKRVSMDRYTESAKYWYRCDKCGEKNLGNTNFCPNCGCRMSEGSDG